jgi:multicomponent Na+:H+ antiporter subunit G
MLEIFGMILFFFGTVFLFLSAVGIVRMPDTLTRMQAATKAATLGLILVCLGAICFEPNLWFKLLLLILFILFTNPLSSSILARSSYLAGESKQC